MTTKYEYYQYIVDFYDELDGKVKTCCGIICTSSFSKAMRNIEKYYGEENILKIEIVNNGNLLVYDFEDASGYFESALREKYNIWPRTDS